MDTRLSPNKEDDRNRAVSPISLIDNPMNIDDNTTKLISPQSISDIEGDSHKMLSRMKSTSINLYEDPSSEINSAPSPNNAQQLV